MTQPSAVTALPDTEFVRAPGLDGLPSIRHGFFGRSGGHSTGLYTSLNCGPGSADDPAAVRKNRETAARSIGLSDGSRLVTIYQVHSPDAVIVTEPWSRGDAPKADGMATRTPGIALGILTADCCPVLFADRAAGVIGAAHAGWRGAFSGVLEATIASMQDLGAAPGRIVAVLGPTISQQNYEVGPEFHERFLEGDETTGRFFEPSARDSHSLFDLPGYVRSRLALAGVGTVEDLAACTYGLETDYFSYRRSTHRDEPDYGRNLSAIVLTGAQE